jgi:hypothetical protein
LAIVVAASSESASMIEYPLADDPVPETAPSGAMDFEAPGVNGFPPSARAEPSSWNHASQAFMTVA